MLYFVNPASSRRKGRKVARRKKKPTRKQLAARRKFAAMARARAKAARGKKRATTRKGPIMARRRKRTVRRASTRRRRSAAKRRSPVTTLRRRAVYQTNPRKRRGRRRGYRRNAGIVAQATGLAKDTTAVLVGAAVGRTASNFLPSFGNPIADAAKGILVAIGVRMLATRFVGADMARLAAAGAMQVPLKALITGFVPQAGQFLGDYDDSTGLAAYSGDVAGYIDGSYVPDGMGEEMGSYSGDAVGA